MAVLQDTFFGATVAFAAGGPASIDILSGGRSGVSVVDIITSHANTTGDVHTYIPADLVEGGQYDFDIAHDPDDDIDALVGVSTTITITYATPVGGSTPATKVFTGWINSWDEDLPIDDRMTGAMSIKVASDPVSTAST